MKKHQSKKEIHEQDFMDLKKEALPTLSIDEEIAKTKSEIANSQNERWREYQQNWLEYLVMERELRIKSAKAIINAGLKGTTKFIKASYPRIINETEDRRYFQLQTNRKHFSEEIINACGSLVKFINCTCKDGIVRIFEIKIEAITGYPGRRGYNYVNVYFSLRNHHESENQVPVKYSIN